MFVHSWQGVACVAISAERTSPSPFSYRARSSSVAARMATTLQSRAAVAMSPATRHVGHVAPSGRSQRGACTPTPRWHGVGSRAWSPSSASSRVPRALTPKQEELYLTLGVAPGASAEAVKRAYKRMAKLYHPDVCDEPDAAARFNEIKAAFETISAERGNHSNVGSEEWRGKWQEQLRQMRAVERGAATVNVRRRSVGKVGASAPASVEPEAEVSSPDAKTAVDTDKASVPSGVGAKEADTSESGMTEEERVWQRDQEMRWTVRSQLSNLRDRTRRRRQVTPLQKNKFIEPFVDFSPTAHDDEWNHTVQ